MNRALMAAETLAQMVLERTQPDEAIKQAVIQIVEGFQSMQRLGFSADEIVTAYQAEIKR